MKIGVVGNCQAAGLARCLAALVPGAEAEAVTLRLLLQPGGAAPDPDRVAAAAAMLADCDLVVAQPAAEAFGELATERLAQRVRRHRPVPAIAFTGFHPDCVYVHDTARRELQGPLGPYHSALALGCFVAGLPPERAARLFNAHTHAALGYHDAFARDMAALRGPWAAMGYDLDAAAAATPGAFMHTINHPTIGFLHAVARQALQGAGITPAEAPPPAHDELAWLAEWPVYPDIARRLGVPGGMRFRLRDNAPLDLPAMLAQAYAAFAAMPQLVATPHLRRTIAFLRSEVLNLPDAGAADAETARRLFQAILGRDPAPAELDGIERAGIGAAELRLTLLRSTELRKTLAAPG